MLHQLSLQNRRAATAAAGVLVLAGLGINTPAHAVSYGTPTITLSAGYLSGAVGATGDPVVTVTVAQSGADVTALGVAASASI
nr:hypothetical protein OG781_13620 [Streptomyces sp. NBC_00830]